MKLFKTVISLFFRLLTETWKVYRKQESDLKRLAEVMAPRKIKKTRGRFYPAPGTFAFIRKS